MAFAKAAYRKYWLEGRGTSDEGAVVEVGTAVGFDRKTLTAAIREMSVKERLARENQDAIAKGIFGSPFFIADGEPFWGSDRMALLSTAGGVGVE